MDKGEIRDLIRQKRREVDDSTRRRAGRAIADHLFADIPRLLIAAHSWNVYLSSPKEVPTRYLVRRLYAEGKLVSVPRWDAVLSCYGLNAFPPGMPLVAGPQNIPEPLELLPVHPCDIDCFIIPGLAFDHHGGRLGYGGGHYDRILSKVSPRPLKIGIGFDFQLLDEPLPLEPHDIVLDYIVTERRTVNCRKCRGDDQSLRSRPATPPNPSRTPAQ